tara:strand:- start:13718 stop:14224 length:507 start_codon:yes stop_codon:yes gene_type:complete
MTNWQMYAQVPALAFLKEFDFVNDVFRCVLLDTAYPASAITSLAHTYYASDVASYEISGTNYTTTGKALVNKWMYWNGATTDWEWRANTLTWTDLGIDVGTVGSAVIYHATTDRVIALNDLVDKATTGRDAIVEMPTNGIFQIQWRQSSGAILGMPDMYEEADIVSVI